MILFGIMFNNSSNGSNKNNYFYENIFEWSFLLIYKFMSYFKFKNILHK